MTHCDGEQVRLLLQGAKEVNVVPMKSPRTKERGGCCDWAGWAAAHNSASSNVRLIVDIFREGLPEKLPGCGPFTHAPACLAAFRCRHEF